MTPPPPDRDASAYADGNPDAVRRARPPEPSEAAWEEMRLRIRARLAGRAEPLRPRRPVRRAAVGAVLTAIAAAVAWVALGRLPVPPSGAPEVAEVKPGPSDVPADPLAEFDALPMAGDDEVVLHRVPGDGWLPIGAHPLPGELALATAAEVELDDPNPAWPTVTPSPLHAPMIFAAKPR